MRVSRMFLFLLLTFFAFVATCRSSYAQASATYPNGVSALTVTRGVGFDVTWKNCTGVTKVTAVVIDQKTGKKIAEDSFSTTEASASKVDWAILLPDSNAGDVVYVTVYVYNGTGGVIASTGAQAVTLK